MSSRNDKFDTSSKDDLEKRLDEMNKRLGRETNQDKTQDQSRAGNAGMAMGLRLGTEFVSAILVGAIMGYGIDWMIGTTPFAMISFLLLGFVAGVMNVLRASGEMSGSYELNVSKEDQGRGKTD